MGKQRHVILKQTLEITVASDEEAWPLQQKASRIVRSKLKRLIERVCDRLSTPDCLHRIDRLELDLGQLEPSNLAKELPAMFEEAFTKALTKAVAQPDPSGLPAKTASQWELFTQFFHQGTLPWWADLAKPHQPEESIDYLLHHAPDLIRHSLSALASDTPSLQRMIHHLDDRHRAALVAAKAPTLGDFPLALFHALAQTRPHITQIAGTPESRFATHRWFSILQHALLPEPPPADRTDFARGVLMRLACLQAVPYSVLVDGLVGVADSVQNPVKAVAATLMQELRGVQTGAAFARDQEGFNRPLHGNQPPEPPNAVELGVEPSRSNVNPLLPTSLPAGERGFLPMSPESERGDANLDRPPWQSGSDNPHGNDRESLASIALLALYAQKADREGEGIMLGNAGLVILWPFLGEFFERLGLAHEKKIVDENTRQRGVAVLHYLATGDASSPPEYLLPLNKLLCGMDLEAVFDRDSPLTEAETSQCDDFLTAAIAQAPILHDMSIAGLRGNFLLRAGILQIKYGSWLLRVERETFDVVLDRFPWGFQWVSLPWMQEPLRVEW